MIHQTYIKTGSIYTNAPTVYIPQLLEQIITKVQLVNGNIYLVGGIVRDLIMNKPQTDDIDLECFNVPIETLNNIIASATNNNFTFAGNQFPVFAFTDEGYEIQIALPRTEHSKDDTTVNVYMSLKEAMQRRDLTINSIYIDTTDYEVIDYCGGVKDIKEGILRPTSEKFLDDPVRVIRACRFYSVNDNFIFDAQLIKYCMKLHSKFHTIEKDVIVKELMKALSKSTYPSRFFDALLGIHWLDLLFPSVRKLEEIQQDNIHHPEGNAYVHTMFVLDYMARKTNNPILLLSALFHDVGKTLTQGENFSFINHENVGADMIDDALKQVHPMFFNNYIEQIKELVRLHMNFHCEHKDITKRYVRRVLSKLKYNSFDNLMMLIESDMLSRPVSFTEKQRLFAVIDTVQMIIDTLQNEVTQDGKLQPIVTGKFLLNKGWKQGPKIGNFMRYALEHQIEGMLTIDNVEEWFEQHSHNLDLVI